MVFLRRILNNTKISSEQEAYNSINGILKLKKEGLQQSHEANIIMNLDPQRIAKLCGNIDVDDYVKLIQALEIIKNTAS